MVITHESTEGLGKFAGPRLNLFVDGTRVGVCDWEGIQGKFIFELLRIASEGDVIAQAQKDRVSLDQMNYRCAQRQWAADALASVATPENIIAVREYVSNIPPPQSAPKVAKPEPVQTSARTKSPEPVFVNVGVERELFVFLENRVEKIEAALKPLGARLSSLESSVKEFNFDEIRKRLQAIDAKIVNVEAEERVIAAHLKTHLKRCWRDSFGGAGFRNPSEIPDDLETLNAPRKL
jgi:hypothetical protein